MQDQSSPVVTQEPEVGNTVQQPPVASQQAEEVDVGQEVKDVQPSVDTAGRPIQPIDGEVDDNIGNRIDTEHTPEVPDIDGNTLTNKSNGIPAYVWDLFQNIRNGWETDGHTVNPQKMNTNIQESGRILTDKIDVAYSVTDRAIHFDVMEEPGVHKDMKLILYFDANKVRRPDDVKKSINGQKPKPQQAPKEQPKPQPVRQEQPPRRESMIDKIKRELFEAGMDSLLVKYVLNWMNDHKGDVATYQYPFRFHTILVEVFPLLNPSLMKDFDGTVERLKKLFLNTRKDFINDFIDRESMILARKDPSIGEFVTKLSALTKGMPKFTYIVSSLIYSLSQEASKILYQDMLTEEAHKKIEETKNKVRETVKAHEPKPFEQAGQKSQMDF